MFRESNNQQSAIPQVSEKPLIHKLESSGLSSPKKNIIIIFMIIILGIGSGFLLTKVQNRTFLSVTTSDRQGGADQNIVVGSGDTKVFKDSAEGELQIGGINGEGTHRLIRAGGESQTVYLTSSVLDLSQFEGKNVKVWGETFAAQKAGWLMDVGKVEVLGN